MWLLWGLAASFSFSSLCARGLFSPFPQTNPRHKYRQCLHTLQQVCIQGSLQAPLGSSRPPCRRPSGGQTTAAANAGDLVHGQQALTGVVRPGGAARYCTENRSADRAKLTTQRSFGCLAHGARNAVVRQLDGKFAGRIQAWALSLPRARRRCRRPGRGYAVSRHISMLLFGAVSAVNGILFGRALRGGPFRLPGPFTSTCRR